MINRRSFLQQTGIISAGIMLMPDLLTAKTNRQYGLQLFAFREQLPKEVNSIISKIAKAGYKQVEPFGYSKANGNKVPSRMSRSCGIFLLALNGFI